jgi:cytochrome b
MRDVIIKATRIKIELLTLLVCFVVANLLNVYAILTFKTSFSELFTQLGYVFIFSVVLYLLWSLLRVIFYLIKKYLITKNK